MEMGMHLGQRLEQRLKMTSQMIQSIELLQLPIMALEQRINQEMLENPLLEMELESPETEGEERADAAEQIESTDEAEPDDFEKLANIAEDDAWEEMLTSSPASRIRRGDEDPKLGALQNTAAPPATLQDHLIEQLTFAEAPPRTKELAREIVHNLDPSGYLRHSLAQIFENYGREDAEDQDRAEPESAEETKAGERAAGPESAEETKAGERAAEGEETPAATAAPRLYSGQEPEEFNGTVSREEAEAALELLQSLDPTGVGARSVEECLILQLRGMPEETEFERRLVREHLDDLCNNRLPKVAKELDVSIERIKEGLAKVGRLNPRPGAQFSRKSAQFIVPDVAVEEIDGEYVVRMNDSRVPRMRISPSYRELLRQAKRGSTTRSYLRQKFQSAQWLVGAIEQRRNTLQRIANEIVTLQRDFFERGPMALKPLMMQEIADRIGMHVSTVSRAIAEKYMQTPRGLFPLRSFFTTGFSRAPAAGGAGAAGERGPSESEAVSNRTVMLTIEEMVRSEEKKKPLSDQEIATRLLEKGLEVARRTVAKYREKLGIPSSRRRREY